LLAATIMAITMHVFIIYLLTTNITNCELLKQPPHTICSPKRYRHVLGKLIHLGLPCCPASNLEQSSSLPLVHYLIVVCPVPRPRASEPYSSGCSCILVLVPGTPSFFWLLHPRPCPRHRPGYALASCHLIVMLYGPRPRCQHRPRPRRRHRPLPHPASSPGCCVDDVVVTMMY